MCAIAKHGAKHKILFNGFIFCPLGHYIVGTSLIKVVFRAKSFATTFEVVDVLWNKIFDKIDEKWGKNEISGE